MFYIVECKIFWLGIYMLHKVKVMWGSVIESAMASRSVRRLISSVGKLWLTRIATPPLDLLHTFLFFLKMLKWVRVELLFVLKLVSCRHIIEGLWS